ncbi:MAG TPA: glycoside hydrolase family 43 protein [Lacunisphaera sp.]|nr:glycoside hydrolase family 43 protein [Lacunisphaera sp.]
MPLVTVQNPILPGFHPDPCILRHKDWFYVATSTFEWWPGVQINRSRDLASWEVAGYALTRRSQLDLRGVPDSGGVWAPALSHADDRFWLIYSDMKSFAGPAKDVHNYLVTAPAITGPWSEPVYLNSSGFDPSLFHDADGHKWLVNQLWKSSTGPDAFDGIVLQEYSVTGQRLIGAPRRIFAGSALGCTEGPHLYRKDGFYYLVTAEGGTSWTHAVTVARARALAGPYELSPHHPLVTSAGDRSLALQKAGHGSFVQDASGQWYLAHLCARPVPGTNRCTLGRETALQALDWPKGDWPRLADGGHRPRASISVSGEPARPYFERFHDNFEHATLSPHWNTLREPASADWLTLAERPGWLRLRGRFSIQSRFDQSLVGCRVAHHRCDIRTMIDYQPSSPRQRAGLALFYNTANFYQLYVSADEQGVFANVLACDNGQPREDPGATVRLPDAAHLELHARLRDQELTFFCCGRDGAARPVGGVFDATTLSDDYPVETGAGWAFTGLFAVLCAQDSTGENAPADFDWFHYEASVPA